MNEALNKVLASLKQVSYTTDENTSIDEQPIMPVVFTEEEIKNFYVTFCQVILNYNKDFVPSDKSEAIYKAVLEFFANGKTDCASKLISLILETSYYSTDYQYLVPNIFKDNCQCPSTNSSNSISAYSLYMNAMDEYLKHLLGSTDFYQKLFYYVSDNEVEPKYELISSLKTLIQSFLNMDIDLSFNTNTTFYCSYEYSNNASHIENTNIIKNYLNVLDYIVEKCGLQNNKNKIKVYGENFGKLLPKLRFV